MSQEKGRHGGVQCSDREQLIRHVKWYIRSFWLGEVIEK